MSTASGVSTQLASMAPRIGDPSRTTWRDRTLMNSPRTPRSARIIDARAHPSARLCEGIYGRHNLLSSVSVGVSTEQESGPDVTRRSWDASSRPNHGFRSRARRTRGDRGRLEAIRAGGAR